ncbi:C40 family peptidase [Nocardioides sp. MAHUQ-72]|uniref:C40 family peptidase n=1 Tax=unclassified Nocardioides TaxID=2615069 RepID=UPI00361356BA
MSARLRALVALPALLLGLLTALVATSVVTAPAADAATRNQRVLHARTIALHQLGDPYRYGAAGPRAFDCSGLVYYSYRRAGFAVPRTSRAQAGHARHIRRSHLRPGDFLFFTGSGGVYHVGIFLRRAHGHVVMVHSPRPGQRVRREVPWTSHWFAGTLRGR